MAWEVAIHEEPVRGGAEGGQRRRIRRGTRTSRLRISALSSSRWASRKCIRRRSIRAQRYTIISSTRCTISTPRVPIRGRKSDVDTAARGGGTGSPPAAAAAAATSAAAPGVRKLRARRGERRWRLLGCANEARGGVERGIVWEWSKELWGWRKRRRWRATVASCRCRSVGS